MNRTAAGMLIVFAVVAGGQALAHHSFAMFDDKKEVTITGEVKEFDFTNPHSWIHVDVNDPGTHTVSSWAIETASPNFLRRAGWSRDTLKPGDKVAVIINPLKDGTNGGSLVRVTLPDGRIMSSTKAISGSNQ
ncbi:MAG: DUF6152 family protein [Steroidobacteraceae bacterium]